MCLLSGTRPLLLLAAVAPLACGQSPPGTAPPTSREIHEAIRAGDLDTVESMLARNPELLTARNRDDREPLHEACILGEVPIMELLVSRGADINARSKAENTTLHWAVHAFVGQEVRGEMVAILLGLDPELATARNINGLTPLHWSGNELPETIQLLLDSGADLDAQDKNGLTPLQHWVRYWEDDESEFLIGAGADLELTDDLGRTALHLAAIGGRHEKYRMLADAGGNLNPRDQAGLTPADYARKFGHNALADLMVVDGALESEPLEPLSSRPSAPSVGRPLESSLSHSLLADGPAAGEAAIWYLDSNAWAVRTEGELLIFDYTDWGPMPRTPGMVNGRIQGSELVGLSVTVFATSPRAWQESLLELRGEVEDVRFVLGFDGFEPGDATWITVMEGEGALEVGDLEVTAVKSEHGGTAFLVRADGLTVFHSGLPDRYQPGGAAAWSRGLLQMKNGAPEIDLAFIPTFVAGDDEVGAVGGFLDVTGWIQPKIVFPAGGSGAQMYLYREAAELAEERWSEMTAIAPANRGDLFRVTIIT